MAKLTSQEYDFIISSMDELLDNKFNKPFIAPKGFSFVATRLVKGLEDLRREALVYRTFIQEDDERLQSEIANVTHDLKTPLALILGAVECIEDGFDDKDYLSVIKEKTTAMNQTVLRIIESSRSHLLNAKKAQRVMDATTFLPHVCENLRILVEGKKIKYSVSRVPKVLVSVSETDINSVIENLVTNAVKYTEKGKIKVSFQPTRNYLYISVKDTGKGISQDRLPYLFDRFYTEDVARTSGGTGVGLSYVKEVITDHGGKITVHSKLGKGSTFSISIPRAEPKSLRKMSSDQKKCLEASLRIFLFPLFLPVDIFRSFHYGIRYSRRKVEFSLNEEE